MGQNLTSKAWQHIVGESWTDNIKSVVEAGSQLIGISEVSAYLPYCAISSKDRSIDFIKLNSDALQYHIASKHDISLMVLFTKEEYNKRSLGLRQTFPARVPQQYITRNTGYFYKWSNENVTITKFLGVTDIDKISQQASELLIECHRFNFMYCEPPIIKI